MKEVPQRPPESPTALGNIVYWAAPPPPGSTAEQKKSWYEMMKAKFMEGQEKPPTPEEGELKVEWHFAWWPKKVANKTVWLREYQRMLQWRTRDRTHSLYGYGWITLKNCGGWDFVGERI